MSRTESGRLRTPPAAFAYVEPPDIPEGVTLDAYRRAHRRARQPDLQAPPSRRLLALLTYPIRLFLYDSGLRR